MEEAERISPVSLSSGTAVAEPAIGVQPAPVKEAIHDLAVGLWSDNGVSRQILGLCSVLAITNTVMNCIGMGIAATFVLTASNALVSAFRKYIPYKVRLPIQIAVIASFVTITDLFIAAYLPSLHESLGIFIPLIVVNCIVFARADLFAYKNTVLRATADGLGMGLGYTFFLLILGSIREFFGSGSILGHSLLGPNYVPFIVAILPAGAFLVFGFMVAGFNKTNELLKRRA